jgi:hypothetical protein
VHSVSTPRRDLPPDLSHPAPPGLILADVSFACRSPEIRRPPPEQTRRIVG